MTQLTQNFSLKELTRSDIAIRNGIDNSPSANVLENLKLLASKLEVVRSILGCRVYVNSALRVEALERIVAWSGFTLWCRKRGKPVNDASWAEYFVAKAHPKGLSADIEAPDFGPPQRVFDKLYAHRGELGYDQLILEFPPDGWVHVAFPEIGKHARNESFTIT